MKISNKLKRAIIWGVVGAILYVPIALVTEAMGLDANFRVILSWFPWLAQDFPLWYIAPIAGVMLGGSLYLKD